MSAFALDARVAPASPVARFAWLRERGMGASVLVAGLSSAFGVLLLVATGYIGALLSADPYIGGSELLGVIITILGMLLLGVAVYVAAIVTANTFATIVAGRTRQIALMRLIGASAQSERKAVANRGLAVGAIGAALGLVLAVAAAYPLVALAGQLMGVHGLDFHVLSPQLAIPALAVALTTWAAAWAGSRRVLNVTPLQALGGSVERTSDEVRSPARTVVSIVLMAAGALLIAGGIAVGMVSPLGVVIAFVGGLLSFTGMSLGASVIMPPILRLVGRMFGRSATARLAAENAMRYPERSSRMAIGVVMGVTLVTMFAVASQSAKQVIIQSGGGEELDPMMSAAIDGFTGVMIGLVAVSAVIAAVGLVNLLTIGVVQRRRELGLLRSLGFTNAQVRRMILLEALHVVIAALVTGLVLGVVYGWAGAQSTLGSVRIPPEFHSPTFIAPSIPWGIVAGVVAATAVLTLVASLAPTRLATRIQPVEALSAD